MVKRATIAKRLGSFGSTNRLQHSLTTFKAKTRESKGCQSGQGNGQKRRYSRNDDRVLEPGEEGEDGVGNQLLKVLEAPSCRDEFLICQVVDRIDGRRDDPKHRKILKTTRTTASAQRQINPIV